MRVAYKEGRKLYDAERYPESTPYLQVAVDAGVMGASELLILSKNRAEIDRELSVKNIWYMDSEDLKELRCRAKGGDVIAMRLLGLRLIDGATPVSSNASGMKWLISAHNHGDAQASKNCPNSMNPV